MKLILGIDIGGSTTKIVVFNSQKNMVDILQIKSSDQITSLYEAIGNILYRNNLSLQQVEKIVLTGVGASSIKGNIYGLFTEQVKEFDAIGFGGLTLSNLQDALVVSIGTGTAFVRASRKKAIYIGGSGIGGGTLIGLSSILLGENRIDTIIALAEHGKSDNLDLSIGEISSAPIPSLPSNITASNFGKINSIANKSDISLGLIKMVFQAVGMMSVFACGNSTIKNIVVTGSTATLPQAKSVLNEIGALYNLNFIIPHNAAYATAIGAAILCIDGNNLNN